MPFCWLEPLRLAACALTAHSKGEETKSTALGRLASYTEYKDVPRHSAYNLIDGGKSYSAVSHAVLVTHRLAR